MYSISCALNITTPVSRLEDVWIAVVAAARACNECASVHDAGYRYVQVVPRDDMVDARNGIERAANVEDNHEAPGRKLKDESSSELSQCKEFNGASLAS